MGFLGIEDFGRLVETAPLISVDLVIVDDEDRALLHRRNFAPARGWWFVPGGRVRKNETVQTAISRILLDELGIQDSPSSVQFIGFTEHFYLDSFESIKPTTTHYVSLGHLLTGLSSFVAKLVDEGNNYRFDGITEAMNSDAVHDYAKSVLSQLYPRIDSNQC